MADLSNITLPDGDNYNLKDLNAAESIESTGGSGVRLKKRDGSSFSTSVKINTQDLVRPTGLRGLDDPTLQTLVSTTRANRLAFLPADQIIIEQTIDGGTTWTDAGVNDAVKLALFSETRPRVYIPRINDTPSLLCGLRITFTAMKYNVPSGTPETEKYNYWSSQYVKSTERYCQLKELYFWVSTTYNSIGITVQRANGATPNNWINLFNDSSFYMTGWSGCDYVSFSPGTFGGSKNQTGQPWNYRITLMTKGVNGTSTMGSSTIAQCVLEIRGYGDSVWTSPNQYMANDHMYSKDPNQNVAFPAQVTATNFAGEINNHTVESNVPSDAVFTDTKPSAQCETAAATAAKAATCTYYALKDNSYLHVNVRNSNTAVSALTLNVNSRGAKPIYINGEPSSASNNTLPAGTYIVFYDGTNYQFRTDGKLPASISGDAGTVNSHTVEKNVPSDAVFTDTTDLTQMIGILPAAKGGTGETTLRNASNSLINALQTGVATTIPEKDDYFISQYVGGNGSRSGDTNANKYYRRPISVLFGAMESSDVTDALGYSPAPSIYFGHCATAAATADKVVELDDPTGFTLRNGVMICVSYDATNTASNVTLNVEGTGAKAISQVEDTAYTGTSNTITGHTSYYTYYVYNGTYWCFVNYSANTTNNANTVPSAQCETAAAKAAKAATCTYYALKDNSYLHVNVRNSNTAVSALTLNVNSRGAKPIYINGEPSSASNNTLPAGTYIVFYNGTNWYFRTDDKLPANIDGDSDTVDGFNFGVDDDQNVQVGWDGDAPEIVIPTSTALPIDSGGTGATTAAEARTNLGLGSAATYNVVSTVNNDSNLVTGAAIKNYYEAVGIPSAICTTIASTANKVATCSSYSLLANSYIQVILANANSASSALTLNINDKGAKPIYINGSATSSSNKTLPAGSYFVFYDGTNYYFRTDGKITGDITGTVNGHSVNKDVPSNAVFTDTTALASMTGTLGIDHGGTGATSASAARSNLGLGAAAVKAVVNNTTTTTDGSVLDARVGATLATTIANKGRNYSTETLATFYTNVAADKFEMFTGTTDFTSKLSSSTASGVCFGFAIHNSANSFVEGLMFNTSSGKLYSYRISSSGAISYNKSVAFT